MISDIEIDISKFILNQKSVHYSDLENHFQISKPTISKYLSDIASFVESLDNNFELVRARKNGIYFSGNTEVLNKYFTDKQTWRPITPKDRRMYILSSLIFKKSVTTMNDLTSQLFISRRTLENDLVGVREFIGDNNGRLVNSCGILKLEMPKDYLYAFMIYIFHDYWGENIVQSDDKNVVFPPILKNFFNEDIAKHIFKFIDKFLNVFSFRTSDYEYTSLIIYILIQYTLFSNSSDIVRVKNLSSDNTAFELETEYLANSFQNEFQYSFTNEQKSFLNNFIILIKSENNRKLSFNQLDEISLIKKTIIGKDTKVNIYDNQFLDGLSKHISLAIKRIRFGMKVRNPYTDNFKRSYPIAFDDALELSERINKTFGIKFNDDEITFIGMYFESLSERKSMVTKRITAMIVCNTGIGTSRFLEEKIKNELSDTINVKGIMVAHELSSLKIDSDIIISTIPLMDIDMPYVLVSPFLTSKDKEKIMDLIDCVKKKVISKNIFRKLFCNKLVVDVGAGLNYQDALKCLSQRADANGYSISKDEIYYSSVDREKLSSTAIDGVALPHCNVDHIRKPFIGVIKSKAGIDWLGSNVNIAFFMGLRDIDSKSMKIIYHELNKIVENKKTMDKLINSKSSEELISYLEEDNFD